MKKLVTIILIIVLTVVMTSIVFSKSNDDEPISEEKVNVTDINTDETLEFTLDEAINYALKNSPLIGISETRYKKAELNYKEAEDTYDKLNKSKGGYSFSPSSIEMKQAKDGYYLKLAEMSLLLAEKGKEQTVEMIKFSVESSYFNLLNSSDKLKIQEQTLNISKENLDHANKKYEIGMISEVQLMSSKLGYSQAKAEYNKIVRENEYNTMEFNKTLGLPFDTDVVLTDTLEIHPPEEVDLKELVNQAYENRMEVLQAKKQLEADEINFECYSKWYTENTYKYQEKKEVLESSKYSLKNTKDDVKLSLIDSYNNMINAYDSLKITEETVEQMQKLYDITKIKYDSGMATNTELNEALNNLKEAKLSKAQLKLAYNLAKLNFELSYGVGLPSSVQM